MSDDWETPKWLLEIAFPDGRFFDPCPIGGRGGLKLDWPTDVPVFINPPYSNPKPWVERAFHHPGAVALFLPCDPTAAWWGYSSGFRVSLIDVHLRYFIHEDGKQSRLVDGGEERKKEVKFYKHYGTATFANSWWRKV